MAEDPFTTSAPSPKAVTDPGGRRDQSGRGALAVAGGGANIVRRHGLPTPAARGAALVAGTALILASPPAPFLVLVRQAQALLDAHLSPLVGHPSAAHRLPAEVFAERMWSVQRAFANDAQVRQAFWRCVDALYEAPHAVFRDQLYLRALPPEGTGHERFGATAPHRDSWGSRILAQENWWAPVYAVEPRNTLALYLDYWSQAVDNDSATWSFDAFRRHRAAAGMGAVNYPSAPRARVTDLVATPLLMEVGQLALFSGAHLHGAVGNRSDVTRFSLETRTLEVREGKLAPGPPNVDTALRPPHLEWFRDRFDVTAQHAVTRRAPGDARDYNARP